MTKSRRAYPTNLNDTQPAELDLGDRREARPPCWLSSVAQVLDRGADLRLAESPAALEQRLRTPAHNQRSVHLCGDASPDGETIGSYCYDMLVSRIMPPSQGELFPWSSGQDWGILLGERCAV